MLIFCVVYASVSTLVGFCTNISEYEVKAIQIDSPTFSLKTNGTGPQPVVVFTVSVS